MNWPALSGAFACVLVAFVAITAILQGIRATRAERQLEDERRMRRGFSELKRYGWLPEDTQ